MSEVTAKTAEEIAAEATAAKAKADADAALIEKIAPAVLPLISISDADSILTAKRQRLQGIEKQIDAGNDKIGEFLGKDIDKMLEASNSVSKLNTERNSIESDITERESKLDALPEVESVTIEYAPTCFGLIALKKRVEFMIENELSIRNAFIDAHADSEEEIVKDLLTRCRDESEKIKAAQGIVSETSGTKTQPTD